MNEIMLGVPPAGETQNHRKAFWILCDFGGYPKNLAYECSRCESTSAQPTKECPTCGAEMSNMVIQSMWVDFNE